MRSWPNKPDQVLENIPLADKTTWQIGGLARYYAEPGDVSALSEILASAEEQGIRIYTLGGGSNLLITDDVLDGLVVRLDREGSLGGILSTDKEIGRIVVGSAMRLPATVDLSAELGLSGLEDLAGIPGTVGGAVVMNAGNPMRGIGSLVEWVHGVDLSGRQVAFSKDQLHFSYRWSNLGDVIVTEVALRLQVDASDRVRETVAAFRDEKRSRQPLAAKSAGCVFRNAAGQPAGLLIDQAGLKGYRHGDAEVSGVHANYIVNAGDATCADVRHVVEHVRSEVKRVHGVDLQLEIRLWL